MEDALRLPPAAASAGSTEAASSSTASSSHASSSFSPDVSTATVPHEKMQETIDAIDHGTDDAMSHGNVQQLTRLFKVAREIKATFKPDDHATNANWKKKSGAQHCGICIKRFRTPDQIRGTRAGTHCNECHAHGSHLAGCVIGAANAAKAKEAEETKMFGARATVNQFQIVGTSTGTDVPLSWITCMRDFCREHGVEQASRAVGLVFPRVSSTFSSTCPAPLPPFTFADTPPPSPPPPPTSAGATSRWRGGTRTAIYTSTSSSGCAATSPTKRSFSPTARTSAGWRAVGLARRSGRSNTSSPRKVRLRRRTGGEQEERILVAGAGSSQNRSALCSPVAAIAVPHLCLHPSQTGSRRPGASQSSARAPTSKTRTSAASRRRCPLEIGSSFVQSGFTGVHGGGGQHAHC